MRKRRTTAYTRTILARASAEAIAGAIEDKPLCRPGILGPIGIKACRRNWFVHLPDLRYS